MMTVRHSLRLVDEGGPDPDFAQDRLDRLFFALSDPVRRQILERLDGQALLVSELAAPFEISLQAVSRHIQVLVRAGLIQQERTGRISRCSLDAGPLLDAAVWMNRYSKYWQQQFDLLAATLSEIDERRMAQPTPAAGRKRAEKRSRRKKWWARKPSAASPKPDFRSPIGERHDQTSNRESRGLGRRPHGVSRQGKGFHPWSC